MGSLFGISLCIVVLMYSMIKCLNVTPKNEHIWQRRNAIVVDCEGKGEQEELINQAVAITRLENVHKKNIFV